MAFRALNCSRVPVKVGRAYYSTAASTGFVCDFNLCYFKCRFLLCYALSVFVHYSTTAPLHTYHFIDFKNNFLQVKPAFIDVPRPVLGEYRADVPASTGPKNVARAAKVTTLANGLRVASLTSADLQASVGLFVGVGTRNETRSNAGATHFLKFSAFGSSTERPGYQIVRELEAAGANFVATAGREQLSFSAEVAPNKLNDVVPIIRGVLSPKLAYHEVAAQAETVKEDVERLDADPITSIFELVHRQAYRNRGLGQSLAAVKDNIHHINQETLAKFVDSHYNLDQAVFVGVGMHHERKEKKKKKSKGKYRKQN